MIARRRFTFLAAILAVVLPGIPLHAAKPRSTTPKIRYQLKWLDKLGYPRMQVMAINNLGDAVGRVMDSSPAVMPRRAWYYCSAEDRVYDLNALAPQPDGFVMMDAYDINDLGQIVGTLSNAPPATPYNGMLRAYRFDTATDTVTVLPMPLTSDGVPSTDTMEAYSINNRGDIVTHHKPAGLPQTMVLYQWDADSQSFLPPVEWAQTFTAKGINDAGQILTLGACRYTPMTWPVTSPADFLTEDFRPFYSGIISWGMNRDGSFVGWFKTSSPSVKSAFRYSDAKGIQVLRSGGQSEAYGINSAGHVCVNDDTANFVYTDATGLFSLSRLVTGTDADLAKWTSYWRRILRDMNDPDATGFGQMAGDTTSDSYDTNKSAFILTPVIP